MKEITQEFMENLKKELECKGVVLCIVEEDDLYVSVNGINGLELTSIILSLIKNELQIKPLIMTGLLAL